ncbi:unnamed protein product [Phaeothamnion confervicola]
MAAAHATLAAVTAAASTAPHLRHRRMRLTRRHRRPPSALGLRCLRLAAFPHLRSFGGGGAAVLGTDRRDHRGRSGDSRRSSSADSGGGAGRAGGRCRQCARSELAAHKHNRTWRRSSRRPLPGRTIIGSRWVFTKKRAEDGTILRYKARLVGQGFRQRHGVDSEATFAPVMSADAMHFLLSLAAEFGFKVHQMDVVMAYLSAPLTEQLWMRPPPGPFGFEGCVALELLKAIHGLKHAAYLWHIYLRTCVAL